MKSCGLAYLAWFWKPFIDERSWCGWIELWSNDWHLKSVEKEEIKFEFVMKKGGMRCYFVFGQTG